MRTADSIVTRVRRLIEANDLSHAARIATQGLTWIPTEVRLLRLLGVIAGLEQRHLDARKHFLAAYELAWSDVDLANCLTSVLALEDPETAFEILRESFAAFSDDAKMIAAKSLNEAIRVGVIEFAALPIEVQRYLKAVDGSVP